MTAALDGSQRTALERLVTQARRVLEDDLLERASGRFGIDSDGTIADENALRLDPSALARRRELVEVVDHLRSEGEVPASAVSRILREATFTHLNRLVAIRIAEALGLLPPSLADGRSSQGFRDLLELVPSLAGDDTGGYWTYLSLCGDELAGDVPALFDPRNPLLALTPSPGALDDIVELLAAPDAMDLWLAPDCLGWVYQFFNTGDERRAMREGSAAPRDSRELAVRNQFFTPRYVVDFLVQNSLGRRLIDADPTSPLLDELPLLIDPATDVGEPIDLDDVSMLDPACGSGHFLLAGYDVLEGAWRHAGISAAEAAPAIVRSLWGIDIDPRCAQVAAAAVIFRARRSCPDGELPRPNIVCARAIPATSTGLDEVLAAMPDQHRRLVEAITEDMTDAPILGPLLKIEERLSSEVRAAAFGGASDPESLAGALSADSLQPLEDELLRALAAVADSTISSPAERLLAAEADDAIRFVHALQRRHDAVCMNPPFGEPVPTTKPYLKVEYKAAPSSASVEACFVLRGVSLLKPSGYVGAITSRTGLFLSTYEKWRAAALLDGRLRTLADLGYGVMEQAMVEASAYVVGAPRSDPEATFVRLLRDSDRESALRQVAYHARHQVDDDRLYRVRMASLEALPRRAMAYWLSPWVHDSFAGMPSLEGHGAEVRVGSWPGDDFRFLRLWWEVRSESDDSPWVTYAKGGTYAPFYGEPHLVVAWDRERNTFRGFKGRKSRPTPIPENVSYYFRGGLTWSRRTASNFAVRLLPEGSVFADKGPGIFATEQERLFEVLAWLNSRYARLFVEAQVAAGEEVASGSASRSYEVGIVQRLPWVGPLLGVRESQAIAASARSTSLRIRGRDEFDEVTRSFIGPGALPQPGTSLEQATARHVEANEGSVLDVLRLTWEIDSVLREALGLDAVTLTYVDESVGAHPWSYPAVAATQISGQVEELYQLPIDELVDRAVALVGGRRYLSTMSHFADRRLELICHMLRAHPEDVVRARRLAAVDPPGIKYQAADDVLSFLLGCALGRWAPQARGAAGEDHSIDLLQPLTRVSPAMSTERDAGGAERSRPLAARSGILLDEPGHALDVDTQLRAAAEALGHNGELVQELLRELKSSSERQHLRKRFFKDHLSRYTKSRRKAPIYWPLYVPSGSWGLWIYVPRLTRETLFAIARHAGDRLDHAEAEIRRLLRERESDGSGRPVREVASALDAEERLVEELRRFRDEADRVAGLGWEPDLDDGIILCAAPLADLFPAWKDAAKARKEVKAGKYPWATVSKWADQL